MDFHKVEASKHLRPGPQAGLALGPWKQMPDPSVHRPSCSGPLSCCPSCLVAGRDLVLPPGGRVQKHSVRIKEPENLPPGLWCFQHSRCPQILRFLYLLASSWPPACWLRRSRRPALTNAQNNASCRGRVCGDGCTVHMLLRTCVHDASALYHTCSAQNCEGLVTVHTKGNGNEGSRSGFPQMKEWLSVALTSQKKGEMAMTRHVFRTALTWKNSNLNLNWVSKSNYQFIENGETVRNRVPRSRCG